MARIDFDLDDLTNTALKRLVKQLLVADDAEEKRIVKNLGKKTGPHNDEEEKNELADLHEEMHGRPKTPMVTEDDLPRKGFPKVPKKGKA